MLDELIKTLLYEGYALYPYTPGATKNATPTPFGIVYPPVYAADNPSTFDRVRIECVVEADPEASVDATVWFLEPAGPRHQAQERRVDVPAATLQALAAEPATVPFSMENVQGRVRVAAELRDGGFARVVVSVHNTTPVESGRDRAGGLRNSMLSTHVVAHVDRGRFMSPLTATGPAAGLIKECRQVNSWPVLATDEDDTILAGAIMLPDHPQLAPESVNNLFDGTEIEEALVLHVLALSDEEREEIGHQDPTVRDMIAKASAITPEEFSKLHYRIELRDPEPLEEP